MINTKERSEPWRVRTRIAMGLIERSLNHLIAKTGHHVWIIQDQYRYFSKGEAQKDFDKCWRAAGQYYVVKQTQVVFVTAATSTTKLLKDFRPSTTVLDEASQMTEVATVSVIATFFQNVQKLVLAEDLMQNSPFVRSDNRNEFAKTTSRSLMERMMITGVPSRFLSVQYRMHPHISDTISRYFSQGRLLDAPNVSGRVEEGIFRLQIQPVDRKAQWSTQRFWLIYWAFFRFLLIIVAILILIISIIFQLFIQSIVSRFNDKFVFVRAARFLI